MPLYDLQCRRGHTFEVFARMSESTDTCRCPQCGAQKCTRIPALTNIERTWHGDETESLCERFDPAGIEELKKEIPSIELNRRGNPVYRNDAHQRRCFREAAATAKRYREEEAAGSATSTKEHV